MSMILSSILPNPFFVRPDVLIRACVDARTIVWKMFLVDLVFKSAEERCDEGRVEIGIGLGLVVTLRSFP